MNENDRGEPADEASVQVLGRPDAHALWLCSPDPMPIWMVSPPTATTGRRPALIPVRSGSVAVDRDPLRKRSSLAVTHTPSTKRSPSVSWSHVRERLEPGLRSVVAHSYALVRLGVRSKSSACSGSRANQENVKLSPAQMPRDCGEAAIAHDESNFIVHLCCQGNSGIVGSPGCGVRKSPHFVDANSKRLAGRPRTW